MANVLVLQAAMSAAMVTPLPDARLDGLPDARECLVAISANQEYQRGVQERLRLAIWPREREGLKQALSDAEQIEEVWQDLLHARRIGDCDKPLRWVRIELREHRWQLRAMPWPVPVWHAESKD